MNETDGSVGEKQKQLIHIVAFWQGSFLSNFSF